MLHTTDDIHSFPVLLSIIPYNRGMRNHRHVERAMAESNTRPRAALDAHPVSLISCHDPSSHDRIEQRRTSAQAAMRPRSVDVHSPMLRSVAGVLKISPPSSHRGLACGNYPSIPHVCACRRMPTLCLTCLRLFACPSSLYSPMQALPS
jgi:hypothetical protein